MSATPLLSLLVLLLSVLREGRASPEQPPNPWLIGVGGLLQDCPRASSGRSSALLLLANLASCARRRALAAIDLILEDDTVPLADGLELVKYRHSEYDDSRTTNDSVTFSVRDLLKRIRERDRGSDGKAAEEGGGGGEEGGWRAKLIKRLARVLKTHVIKIDMERLGPGIANTAAARSVATSQQQQVEPRGRRRRRRQMQMLPIIMMGVLLMGSVLIPMGFQFLAVLGGKALILAKMALMLSSIQGLKKIATNGVNYGLYHSPVGPGEPWHERSTAGIELPSYALNYAGGHGAVGVGGAGGAYSVPAAASSGYLDPASLGYLANRRSASTSTVVETTT